MRGPNLIERIMEDWLHPFWVSLVYIPAIIAVLISLSIRAFGDDDPQPQPVTLSPSLSQPPFLGLSTQAIPTHVIDGDTIEVEIRFTLRIRFLDCWAPETRTTDPEEKKRGQWAKAYLSRALADEIEREEPVTIFVPSPPSGKVGDLWTFGRVLGYVWDDDHNENLSAVMVEAGHATKERPSE